MISRFITLLLTIRPDFVQFYEAGKMVSLGLNPYEKLLTSRGPFNYPPAILPFLSLFSWLPLKNAATVFNFLSLLALFFSLYLLIKISRWKLNSFHYLIIGILLYFYFPAKFTLGMGQINHFILLFLTLGIYFYNCHCESRFNRNEAISNLLSGFFFALAASFKLSPFLILLYLLFKGDFKVARWFILSTMVLFLLPFLFISWPFQKLYYTDIFFRAFSPIGKEVYYNQALSGFIYRTFPSFNSWPSHSGGVIASHLLPIMQFLLLTITFIRLKNLSIFSQWSAILSLMVLINTLSWQHHLVFLIPCFILTLQRHPDPASGGRRIPFDFRITKKYFFLAFAYFLLAINIKNPENFKGIFGALLLSHGFFGSFALWLLSLYF